MPRLPPPTETWAKTREICGRIVRTFVETAVRCAKTDAIFGKTTATFVPTVRICDKTREPSVMTGNNYSGMNDLERVPGNCNRIGKTFGTIVKICAAIVETSEPIGKTAVKTGAISEGIDEICTRIGVT